MTDAAASGDHKALLVALRSHVARTIDDGCAPRDLVGLSRRLIDLSLELRNLDSVTEADRKLHLVDSPFDPEAI